MSMRQLIERARGGDRLAREAVSDLLKERVTRTAGHYARITGMDREDLQQEMWLGMMLGLQQVDATIGDPLCYLFLRAKWRLLEAVRRSERQRADSLDDGLPVPDHRRFEDEIGVRWMTNEMDRRLTGRQRVILRGLLAGYRQEELAERLGCTAANVSYHARKIREGFVALSADSCAA